MFYVLNSSGRVIAQHKIYNRAHTNAAMLAKHDRGDHYILDDSKIGQEGRSKLGIKTVVELRRCDLKPIVILNGQPHRVFLVR